MYLDAQNPVFRKKIVPWYDADPVCIVMIVFMLFVFVFGFIGVIAANDIPRAEFMKPYMNGALEISDGMVPSKGEFHRGVWVPIFLMISSGGVTVSVSCRLVIRYIGRREE